MPRTDPDQVVRDVARRILELRRAAGLTQAEFAERLRSSVQYASLVERGTQNLTLHKMVEIANVLDVTVEDLLKPPGPEAKKVTKGRPRKAR